MARREIKKLADIESMGRGEVGVLVRQMLEAAKKDCLERPTLENARKIQVTVLLTPTPADSGELEEIGVEVECKSSVPVSRTRRWSCGLGKDGLVYNDLAPDNVQQGTLDAAGMRLVANEDEES